MNGEDRPDTTQSLALWVAMFNSKTLPNVGTIRRQIMAMLSGMEHCGSGGKFRLALIYIGLDLWRALALLKPHS